MTTNVTPIYIQGKNGMSISEQKCYLQHEGNNAAIVQCLDNYKHDMGVGMAWFLGIMLVVMVLIGWVTSR